MIKFTLKNFREINLSLTVILIDDENSCRVNSNVFPNFIDG